MREPQSPSAVRVALRVLQGMVMVLAILLIVLPIQDYALPEFKAWQNHPSAETLRAFQEKKRGEFGLRFAMAIPLSGVALIIAAYLKKRAKSSA